MAAKSCCHATTCFAFMQPLLINVCKEFLKGMVNKNKFFDNTSPFEK